MKKIQLLAILFCSSYFSFSQNERLRLWYTRPATQWLEAVPLGNGRIGAMVFGDVADERVILNEGTLYAEEPGGRNMPDITGDYDLVTGLIRSGQYAEADDYIAKHWTGRSTPCYQPLGDLKIHFDGAGDISGYERELDLAQAVAKTHYRQGGVLFEREIFASYPDSAVIIRIKADRAGAINFRLTLESPHPNAKLKKTEGHDIVLDGQLPGLALRRTLDWVEQWQQQWKYPEIWNADGTRKPFAKQLLYGDEAGNKGMYFEARVHVLYCDGELTIDDDGLMVKGAKEVVLAVAAASSFNGYDKSPSREGVDPARRTRRVIARLLNKNYKEIFAAHVADYTRLFGRVSLRVGTDTIPSDRRLISKDKPDPSLLALYFQFGRYLLIASSRPGSQPANLQGLWNVDRIPPWASAYTNNINLQMNYWGVETANLAECHEPLMQFMREVSVTGAKVAQQMYHRPGWVLHHNTSIWRDAQPVDWYSYVSFWPMGGGWLCEHLWEHYLFNPDSVFLHQTIYPILKGAAQFYDSWLVDDGSGHLLTPVSDSPENMFYYTDQNGQQKSGGITMGSTLDMAIIREVFSNTLEAGRLLGIDREWRDHLQTRLAQLLPYQVGSRGQLLEYYKEYKEVPPRHNTSPYYPLYPGAQITPEKTPGLAAAEEVLLKERGRAGGGWPSAWLACCWARLHQGDTAMKYIEALVSHRHTNFFNGGGAVFQIDGNLGVVAAVTEMLLQSHTGEIELLPALPAAWASGSVKGLKARGGFEVSIAWKDGKMTNSSIKNISGGVGIVRYRERSTTVKLKKGGILYLNERLEPVKFNPDK